MVNLGGAILFRGQTFYMPSEILNEARSFSHLEQVMHWAFGRRAPAKLFTVVTQDEFTHDVVLKLEPDIFLVFDTT